MPTLDETGRWVGAQAWVELRLFEAVGGWVATTPEPEAKARFAAWSRHHAWHAELWLAHRPVVAGLDPDDLVAAPDDGTAAALALLAAPGPQAGDDPSTAGVDTGADTGAGADRAGADRAGAGADGAGTTTVERLAPLVRVVLPRLVVAYDERLAAVSPVQDGALRRTLRLVLTDLADDRRDGERLLQSMLGSGDHVARAAAHQARVEALLVG
jgi:hypothetical protein